MEHPPTRALALNEPNQFLCQYKKGLIIDEVQLAPELFSYLQVEVELLIQEKRKLKANEIKSSKTYNPNFFKELINFSQLADINKRECFLIYAESNELKTSNGELVNWTHISKI